MPPVMRPLRTLIRAVLVAVCAVALLAAPALAQTSPNPSPSVDKGGLCAPWHHCVAEAFMGLTVLVVLLIGLGYMIQRRGFETVAHRQGSPDGVAVERK
jgi:hypothetical protein